MVPVRAAAQFRGGALSVVFVPCGDGVGVDAPFVAHLILWYELVLQQGWEFLNSRVRVA